MLFNFTAMSSLKLDDCMSMDRDTVGPLPHPGASWPAHMPYSGTYLPHTHAPMPFNYANDTPLYFNREDSVHSGSGTEQTQMCLIIISACIFSMSTYKVWSLKIQNNSPKQLMFSSIGKSVHILSKLLKNNGHFPILYISSHL